MPNVQIGKILANLDMVDNPDPREVVHVFLERHPDVRTWCIANLPNWDESCVSMRPTLWGRYHVEYTFELRDLSQSDAVAARLRFS